MNELWEIVRTVIELVLGGAIVTVATLAASKRKAKAEAGHAEMDLAKDYVDQFRDNVVVPLQKEVKGLRRDVKGLKNAVSKINICPHSDKCPVLDELQKQQRDNQGDEEGR